MARRRRPSSRAEGEHSPLSKPFFVVFYHIPLFINVYIAFYKR